MQEYHSGMKNANKNVPPARPVRSIAPLYNELAAQLGLLDMIAGTSTTSHSSVAERSVQDKYRLYTGEASSPLGTDPVTFWQVSSLASM